VLCLFQCLSNLPIKKSVEADRTPKENLGHHSPYMQLIAPLLLKFPLNKKTEVYVHIYIYTYTDSLSNCITVLFVILSVSY